MPTLRIEGVDRVDKKLGRIAAGQFLSIPMEQSLALLQADLTRYPRRSQKPAHLRGRFVSDRQRRYVMMLVRQRGVPYRRTVSAGLQGAWTYRITLNPGGGVLGVLGNNKEYARYVQGDQDQAQIHRGNWPTDRQVFNHRERQIVGFFRRAIRMALSA
jgi:hypothetical protein